MTKKAKNEGGRLAAFDGPREHILTEEQNDTLDVLEKRGKSWRREKAPKPPIRPPTKRRGPNRNQSYTCPGKIRFATYREAEKTRFAHEEMRRVDKGEMRTYRCRNCGGFHNGHLVSRSRKAERGYWLQISQGWHKTHIAFTFGDRLIESWRN